MSVTETLRRVIRGLPVEIVTGKGGMALVFVGDEYAGSVERDEALGTWGAFPLYRVGEPRTSEGMWGAIDALIIEHVETAMKAVTAR